MMAIIKHYIIIIGTMKNKTAINGAQHKEAGVASPVGGQIFSEVLPYLCPNNKLNTNEKNQ